MVFVYCYCNPSLDLCDFLLYIFRPATPFFVLFSTTTDRSPYTNQHNFFSTLTRLVAPYYTLITALHHVFWRRSISVATWRSSGRLVYRRCRWFCFSQPSRTRFKYIIPLPQRCCVFSLKLITGIRVIYFRPNFRPGYIILTPLTTYNTTIGRYLSTQHSRIPL